ncbi:MAG: FtsX-like permease family protein [Microthrixaceae bacterium]
MLGDVVTDRAVLTLQVPATTDLAALVKTDGTEATAARVSGRNLIYGVTAVTTPQEFVGDRGEVLRGFERVVLWMLLFTLLQALVGVVNTLVLSVGERRREFGLLRVAGASRRAVLRMVLLEGVSFSSVGTLLGIAAGTGAAALAVWALASLGLGVFSMPVATVVAIALVALVAGVAASWIPARMASAVPPLEALADTGSELGRRVGALSAAPERVTAPAVAVPEPIAGGPATAGVPGTAGVPATAVAAPEPVVVGAQVPPPFDPGKAAGAGGSGCRRAHRGGSHPVGGGARRFVGHHAGRGLRRSGGPPRALRTGRRRPPGVAPVRHGGRRFSHHRCSRCRGEQRPTGFGTGSAATAIGMLLSEALFGEPVPSEPVPSEPTARTGTAQPVVTPPPFHGVPGQPVGGASEATPVPPEPWSDTDRGGHEQDGSELEGSAPAERGREQRRGLRRSRRRDPADRRPPRRVRRGSLPAAAEGWVAPSPEHDAESQQPAPDTAAPDTPATSATAAAQPSGSTAVPGPDMASVVARLDAHTQQRWAAVLHSMNAALASGEQVDSLVCGRVHAAPAAVSRTDRRLLVVAERPGRMAVESLHPVATGVVVRPGPAGTVVVVLIDRGRPLEVTDVTDTAAAEALVLRDALKR